MYEKYISDENIMLAITNACKHKTSRKEFKDLKENPQKYVEWIKYHATNFKNSEHRPIEIYDGIQRKKRTIKSQNY